MRTLFRVGEFLMYCGIANALCLFCLVPALVGLVVGPLMDSRASFEVMVCAGLAAALLSFAALVVEVVNERNRFLSDWEERLWPEGRP